MSQCSDVHTSQLHTSWCGLVFLPPWHRTEWLFFCTGFTPTASSQISAWPSSLWVSWRAVRVWERFTLVVNHVVHFILLRYLHLGRGRELFFKKNWHLFFCLAKKPTCLGVTLSNKTCQGPLSSSTNTPKHAWPATSAYLSASISSFPPLHQEIAALGEARGRHSRTASPPRWTTVDFFTGRRAKSGGEAEEQRGATAVHRWKMSSASQVIMGTVFHH